MPSGKSGMSLVMIKPFFDWANVFKVQSVHNRVMISLSMFSWLFFAKIANYFILQDILDVNYCIVKKLK